MSRVGYSAFTDIIRSRISADELARDYGLEVSRDGRCRCIFCNGDRDDSLKLYPGDRGYFCFRCHERGDVINLYRALTGNRFRQAVQDLNEQYGLGLPLSGADQQAMQKARAEAERRKRERADRQERHRKLYAMYLNAADAVWIMEHWKKNVQPETRDELWKQRFVISLRYLDEMRDYRDRLYDELFPMQ